MKPDSELLHLYATSGNEAAFAEVLHRHLGMVYGAAVRLLNGDTALAEDVTQAVFVEMARSAGLLAGRESPAGWLHMTTRHMASHAIRAEQRRRTWEKEASSMISPTPTPEISWTQLRPLIDEAVGRLPEPDRNAILLRFFEGLSHREVGVVLRLNENTARMRVERSIEKLREYFARRGITTTIALLSSTLSSQAATMAPSALAGVVTAGSLVAGAAAGADTAVLWARSWLVRGVAAVAVLATVIMLPKLKSSLAPETTAPRTTSEAAPRQIVPRALPKAIGAIASLVQVPNKSIETAAVPASADLAVVLPPAPPAPNASGYAANPSAAVPSADSGNSADENTDQPSPPAEPALAVFTTLMGLTSPPITIPAHVNIYGYAEPERTTGLADLVLDYAGVLKGKTITAVAGGTNHFLMLCSDGTLAAVGYDEVGQLGDGLGGKGSNGKMLFSATPVLVDTSPMQGKKIMAIAAGNEFSLALCADGSVYAWGGGLACFSKNMKAFHPRPTLVSLGALWGKKVTQMAVGYSHALFLCSDGSLVAWGSNKFGELGTSLPQDDMTVNGIPNTTRSSQFYHDPVEVDRYGALLGKKITAIAAGDCNSLALCSDGTIAQWGRVYATGAKTIADITACFAPVLVNTSGVLLGKKVTSLAAGDGVSLAVCSDGTIALWGGFFAGKMNPDPILVEDHNLLLGRRAVAVTESFMEGMGIVLYSDGYVGTLTEMNFINDTDLSNSSKTDTLRVAAIDRGIVMFTN